MYVVEDLGSGPAVEREVVESDDRMLADLEDPATLLRLPRPMKKYIWSTPGFQGFSVPLQTMTSSSHVDAALLHAYRPLPVLAGTGRSCCYPNLLTSPVSNGEPTPQIQNFSFENPIECLPDATLILIANRVILTYASSRQDLRNLRTSRCTSFQNHLVRKLELKS